MLVLLLLLLSLSFAYSCHITLCTSLAQSSPKKQPQQPQQPQQRTHATTARTHARNNRTHSRTHNNNKQQQQQQQQQGIFPKRALVCVTFFVPSCWRQLELPTRQEPRGGGSNDSDSGFGTNVCASQRPWPSISTIPPQGDRRWPGPEKKFGRPPLPSPLPQPKLFGLSFDEEPGGSRPDPLAGVRPKEQVTRHTVEQIIDSAPGLPMLDAPVPQTVDQLVVVLLFFDTFLPVVAEQVVEAPSLFRGQ